jgi:hypothetical protein
LPIDLALSAADLAVRQGIWWLVPRYLELSFLTSTARAVSLESLAVFCRTRSRAYGADEMA